jgi:hypothetical protein
MGTKRNLCEIVMAHLKGNLGELAVDERTILRRILNKYGVRL